jgi:N-acetylmuramoyl-L-alanine amidase
MTAPMTLCRAWLTVVILAWASPALAGLAVVTHEGRAYVALSQVAETLATTLDATASSTKAHIRTASHVVTFTRNWSRVLVDGEPLVLDAPVRVKRGAWLVPATFVTRVLPKLKASVAAASPRLPARAERRSAATAPATPKATLADLRHRSYPSFTRVVVETSDAVPYTIEARGPREAKVRLASVAAAPRAEDVGDGFVASLRLERAGGDAVVSVVFEGQAGDLKASTLADPPRIVLDFTRPREREPREQRPDTTPLRLIVMDAGHGGHDPGASGPTGLTEKEVVLDVTRRAAKLVEDRLDIKVKLSRDADHFVTLRDRTSFANRERADLFVSIHANAHRESASEGVEIYFLSSEATDNAARQVAALENAVIQLEKPSPAAKRGVDLVRSILWDLAQSEFQTESQNVAGILLDSMTRALRIPNRGVKQAGFYVLGGAAMPAVLVEIGFVTNPKEEKKLRDSRYRDEIARAIAEGLAQYKRQWDQRMRTAFDRGRPTDVSR